MLKDGRIWQSNISVRLRKRRFVGAELAIVDSVATRKHPRFLVIAKDEATKAGYQPVQTRVQLQTLPSWAVLIAEARLDYHCTLRRIHPSYEYEGNWNIYLQTFTT